MKKTKLMSVACSLILLFTNCSSEQKSEQEQTASAEQETESMENPFFQAFETPFGVPPFDQIENEHFLPAFKKGMEEQKEEIQAIENSEEKASFENTIVAYENSGKLLQKVSAVFYNIKSAHTNDGIEELAGEIAPMMSEHQDDIMLSESLFERINEVYLQREELGIEGEDLRLLEEIYKQFTRNGALLSEQDKELLRATNSKLSTLSLKFGQNVLKETNNFKLWVEDEEQLAGLPDELVDAAADEAKAAGEEGKWLFTLQNPSVMPFLQYAEDRALREEIWQAYRKRGDNDNEFDNKDIIKEMTELRAKKAALLGFDNYAVYVHDDAMAKHPDQVYELLDQVWNPAIMLAKQELEDFYEIMRAEGDDFILQPWDWRYYAEKVRQQRYSFDESALKPYFSLENVREGIFHTVGNLYGLSFEKVEDIPVYHPEVVAYEVKRGDKHIGLLYMDFHPRESKRGGAWMTSYRKQQSVDGERKAPVISIVCNFSKPSGNKPALLTFDETETFFHEFGHAIHGLLSDVTYESLAGTSVPRDFVELPSQVLENWAGEPAVLEAYAKHYETGEVIPQELIDKMNEVGKFNQGFANVEYLAASYLDLAYHTLDKDEAEISDITEFENVKMKELGLIDEIIPRYRSTYFNHVFAGGYAASYYSYLWSAVLDADAFQAFKETDLFDQETANAFRIHILERGGTEDPSILYRNFRGADPSVEPLLRRRGLLQ